VENRSRVSAQLVGAKGVQFQVYPHGKGVIPGRDIDRALQSAGLQDMVDAVSNIAAGGAGRRHCCLWQWRRLRIQHDWIQASCQKKCDQSHRCRHSQIVAGLAVRVVVALVCPVAMPGNTFSTNSKAGKESRYRMDPHLHQPRMAWLCRKSFGGTRTYKVYREGGPLPRAKTEKVRYAVF
jgi:hypothetical protein